MGKYAFCFGVLLSGAVGAGAQTATDGEYRVTGVIGAGGGTATDGKYVLRAAIGGPVTGAAKESDYAVWPIAEAVFLRRDEASEARPLSETRRDESPPTSPSACAASSGRQALMMGLLFLTAAAAGRLRARAPIA